MRAVHGFMTAGAPARSLGDKVAVIDRSDPKLAGAGRLLDVAVQAQVGVARDEQVAVERSVRGVADEATIAGGFVGKDKRSGLRLVALQAALVSRGVRKVRRQHRVVPSGVRIVAIDAGDLSFGDRVTAGKAKLRGGLQVTLVADFGTATGIDDIADFTPAVDVGASRTMAGFTSERARHLERFVDEICMRCGGELGDESLVAVGAAFRPHKFSLLNARRIQGDVGRRHTSREDCAKNKQGSGGSSDPLGYREAIHASSRII